MVGTAAPFARRGRLCMLPRRAGLLLRLALLVRLLFASRLLLPALLLGHLLTLGLLTLRALLLSHLPPHLLLALRLLGLLTLLLCLLLLGGLLVRLLRPRLFAAQLALLARLFALRPLLLGDLPALLLLRPNLLTLLQLGALADLVPLLALGLLTLFALGLCLFGEPPALIPLLIWPRRRAPPLVRLRLTLPAALLLPDGGDLAAVAVAPPTPRAFVAPFGLALEPAQFAVLVALAPGPPGAVFPRGPHPGVGRAD